MPSFSNTWHWWSWWVIKVKIPFKSRWKFIIKSQNSQGTCWTGTFLLKCDIKVQKPKRLPSRTSKIIFIVCILCQIPCPVISSISQDQVIGFCIDVHSNSSISKISIHPNIIFYHVLFYIIIQSIFDLIPPQYLCGSIVPSLNFFWIHDITNCVNIKPWLNTCSKGKHNVKMTDFENCT